MKTLKLFGLFLSLITLISCNSKKPADKMEWWKDAKFGMFIHWGLYSIPAGEWKDQKTNIGEGTEWIESLLKIPVADYKPLAAQFNPVKFDADSFVLLAKEAGMKYIVLTSKHHEGFAMFKSADPFNVVDATPYKKDIVKAMAEACKKHGMHFGLYYSQAQDWNHKGGSACSGHWDVAQDGGFDKYLDSVAVPQVEEILSAYNPEILWWDTPCEMTKERAAKFALILAKYPNLIVNNRLCDGIAGDLETPEQHIPSTGIPGKNWESCMTMNGTWGYSKYDNNWKSTETLVRNLIDIASKGGNYLLNVGPTSEGLIPNASVVRLKEVGDWMKVNGEAIYGTTASPFKKLDWGRCTVKKQSNKNMLFLHVFDMPINGQLIVPGLASKVSLAYPLMERTKKLKFSTMSNNLTIDLSKVKKDSFATVIVLETTDSIKVYNSPEITEGYDIFIDKASFEITSDIPGAVIHYTTDGSVPNSESAVARGLNKVSAEQSFELKAMCFINNIAISGMTWQRFTLEKPISCTKTKNTKPGLQYSYYEGQWSELPDFKNLIAIDKGLCKQPALTTKKQNNNYGLVFTGFLNVPSTDIYQFQLTSDDGSRFSISGKVLLNDGLHGMENKTLNIALEKGLHPVKLEFFQAGGGDGLDITWQTGNNTAAPIPTENWVH